MLIYTIPVHTCHAYVCMYHIFIDCPYSDPALHLCSKIWIQYGSNFYNFSTKIICNTCDSDCEKNHSSLMNMDDGQNRNRTKVCGMIYGMSAAISWYF